MIKAIIFDYDGVIVDSFYNVFLTWKELTEKYGSKISINSVEGLKKVWVNSVSQLLDILGMSSEHVREQEEIFLKNLKENPAKVFNGVKEVLRELSKDYALIVVSGSPEETIHKRLKEEGIFDLFRLIVPIISQEKNKPDPFHINFALEKLYLNPNEVIYVGDTTGDAEAAKNAGIDKVILVSYGFASRKALEKYDFALIVDSPSKILNAVNKLR